MKRRRPTRCAQFGLMLLVVAPLLAFAPEDFPRVDARVPQDAAALRAQALDLAYNLDHDAALDLLRRAVAQAPGEPAAHRTLAGVAWQKILFGRGTVTVDHYLGSFSRADVDAGKPPPELDAEFRRHVARAIALAEARVAANKRDVQAHYDLGAALGLHASYVATVEGRMLAGFRAASRCYDEHETVLELDPSRKDAGLIAGTYRYVVSTLSLPMRAMAYVVGFGGGRERGIKLLEETAFDTSGGLDRSANTVLDRSARARVGNDASTDALFALILVYNRERRYDEALRVLERLRAMYPRNRLLVIEAGATALRAGRAQQADALLSEGIAALARDNRPRIPGEDGLWHYKRGMARVAHGQIEAGTADLRGVTAATAQTWVHGRARLELGRVALKRGDRAAAAGEARQAETLCRHGRDPACAESARALLRSSNGR